MSAVARQQALTESPQAESDKGAACGISDYGNEKESKSRLRQCSAGDDNTDCDDRVRAFETKKFTLGLKGNERMSAKLYFSAQEAVLSKLWPGRPL